MIDWLVKKVRKGSRKKEKVMASEGGIRNRGAERGKRRGRRGGRELTAGGYYPTLFGGGRRPWHRQPQAATVKNMVDVQTAPVSTQLVRRISCLSHSRRTL